MKPLDVTDNRGIAVQISEAGFSLISAPQCSLDEVARLFGDPRPSRRNRGLVDSLRPTEPARAQPRSLSAIHGEGSLPFHTDTAHWSTPARYILLTLESRDQVEAHTLLLPWRSVVDGFPLEVFTTEPFLVRNSSESFLTTVRDPARRWYRYDRGCMRPTTRAARRLSDALETRFTTVEAHVHVWTPGVILMVDNWHMLHARPAGQASSRHLHRVLVAA